MAKQISVVVDVQGKIDSFKSAVSEMQGYLNKLSLPALQEGKATSLFGQITREIENIQRLTAKGSVTPIDQKAIEKSEQAIANLLGELNLFAKSPAITGAWSKDLVSAWDKATKAIKEYGTAWADIQKRQGQLEAGKAKAQKTIDTKDFRQKELLGTARARETQYTSNINKYNDAQKAAYQKAFDEYRKTQSSGRVGYQKVDTWLKSLKPEEFQALDLSKKFNLDETQAKLKSIQQIISDIEKGNQISTEAATPHKMVGETKDYNASVREAEEAAKIIEDADKAIQNISTETASRVQDLKNALSGLSSAGVDIQKFLPDGKDLNTATYEELVSAFDKLQEELKETADNTPAVEKGMNGIKGAAENLNGVFDETGKSLEELSERQKQAQQTLSRLQYAFSAVSVFQLFKRAIRSAHQAVKELDAAMMETAVVTKYTISDLWAKLPEYTERANRLGVSTLGAYQSATLYYQQGLNDKQVGAISEETLKMARIASLDYADATNYMTAALRGFNMELNEVSAERVNDVYNRLAAMTAADTAGIATAMTKTASIAKSAGIEFEQMAAFLAQIIETTQESPETAGTAMKTVIARFSEVKKLYSEGEILGSDEEGEEINVNKIQEALRKVGISMTGFFTGKEGLGDILIELASKWNTLDVATQRYIATTAAGSRQQSRFIALMQDYSRTQELVGAAYDSEGASQTQFEKTLDSLDAKTQQLKNAWNEFLLDLANSDVIKGVVDLLNGLVTALNKITGLMGSGGSGIAKLLLGLGILKAGRSLLGGMGYMMNPSMLKDYGGNRLMAFRAGAGSAMGLRNYDAKSGGSVIGAAWKQNVATPWRSMGQTFGGKGGIHAYKKNVKIAESAVAQAKGDVKTYQEAYNKAWQKEQKSFREAEQSQRINPEEIAEKDWNRYDKDHEATEAAKSDLNNANANLDKANANLSSLKDGGEAAANALQTTGAAMQGLGQIAGIAAAGCFMLANYLESIGESQAANTVKIIATALTVLSGIFMVVGTASQIAAAQIAAGAATASTAIMSIPIIGWIAAVITAIIALVAIIVNYVDTYEKKIKRLDEALETNRQKVEELSSAYDELLKGRDGYNDLLAQLEGLTKGTDEYLQKIDEINQTAFDLIDKYPNLEWSVDSEGIVRIDPESLEKEIKTTYKRLGNLKLGTLGIQSNTANVKQEQKTEELSGKVDLIIRYFTQQDTNRPDMGLNDADYVHMLQDFDNGTFEQNWVPNEKGIIFIDGEAQYVDKKTREKLSTYDISNRENILEYFKTLSGGRWIGLPSEEYRDYFYNDKGQLYDETTLRQNVRDLGDFLITNWPRYESSEGYKILMQMAGTVVDSVAEVPALSDDFYAKVASGLSQYNPGAKDPLSNFLIKRGARQAADDLREKDSVTKYSDYLENEDRWDKLLNTLEESGKIEDKTKYDRSQSGFKLLYRDLTGETAEDMEGLTEDYIVSTIFGIEFGAEFFQGEQKQYDALMALGQPVVDAFIKSQNNPEDLTNFEKQLLKDNEHAIETIFRPTLEYIDEGTAREYGLYEFGLGKLTNVEGGDWESETSKRKSSRIAQVSEEAGRAYDEVINLIGEDKKLTTEQRQRTLDIFNAVDITSLKDLDTVFSILEANGIHLSDSTSNAITTFIDAIKASGVALHEFTKEVAQSRIKSSRGLIGSIEDGSLEYTWSKDQYEELSELVKGTDQEWILKEFTENVDGTWTYSSEDLNPIISVLQQIAINTAKDALEKAENRNKIAQTASKTIYYKGAEYSSEEGITAGNLDLDSRKQIYTNFINELLGSGLSAAELVAGGLEINEETLKGLTSDQFEGFWNLMLSYIFDKDSYEKAINSYSTGIGITSGQDLYLYGHRVAEKDQSTVEETAEGDKRLRGSVLTDEEATGFMAKNAKDIDEADASTLALAKDWGILTRNIKAGAEAIGNEVATLKKGKEAGDAYIKSLGKAQKALKKTFGKEFSEKEIQDLLPTIEKWVEGDEEAWDELVEYVSENKIKPGLEEDGFKGLIDDYDNVVAQMAGKEVGVQVGLDGTTVVSTVEEMNALTAALAARGITANWIAIPGGPDGLNNYQLVFAANTGGGGGGSKSGGGGGGGSKPWENPYDKYHNLLQKIDELLRQRNDLERQYNKLLENRHTTIAELLKNSRENVANLQKEIAAQEKLQKGRREQLKNLARDDYYFDEKGVRRSFGAQAAQFGINLGDYVKYNEKTQQIDIDWDAFEEVERRSEKDEKWAEIGKFLQKYYDKVSELSQSYEETQDTIEEMEDAIEEIRQRSKEDYLDFEQELYDAIVDHIQQFIDAEQELSDSIKNAESKILDNMRESIDLERQIRDNTKTEEDIADKENRLAYLQRDTTGANAVEIMQLQKEIDEARQNYQDTLVDQELERLSRASEEAAEQRQEQIDLMQEQLDWAAKAGYFWEDVESMIQQAFGSGDTTLIKQLLSGVSDFNEKSMFGDRAWKDELIERFLKASEGRANWELDNAKENHTSWATRIAATGKEGTVGIWWDTDKNQWVDAKGNTYTGVGYDVSTGKWKYEGRSDRVQEEISEDTQSPQGGSGGGGTQEQTQTQKPKTYSSTKTYEGEFEGKATSKTSQQDADNQAMKNAINKAIEEWTARSVFMRDQLNQLKANAQMLPRNAMKLTYQRQIDELTEQLDSLRGKLIKARADLTQYKTGGLSTQTGPAWLDGTPSKPEYVLNSAQTAAFLQLSDVLPSIMNGGVGLNAAPATYVIDVDINVDSISSDYDVDRLSERVKEDIYNDMMYRNVNVVSLRR